MNKYWLEGGHISHKPYIRVLSATIAYPMLPSGSLLSNWLSLLSKFWLKNRLGIELNIEPFD